MNIKNLLSGVVPGRLQSVGVMGVIPLISDLEDKTFIAPVKTRIGTENYGHLVFENKEDKMAIIPVGAAYIVKQAAQNHGLGHVGVVSQKAKKDYDTASCIQETQGGSITRGEHEMFLMPWYLRESGIKTRAEKLYSKLWGEIKKFNKTVNISAGGHLEHFYNKFKDEIEMFTAEFEPVPRQVGVIVLIKGKVVGFERVPNYNYWNFIWKPLIRDSYGSLAIQIGKGFDIGSDLLKKFRCPVSSKGVNNISDITKALNVANIKQQEMAKKVVRELLDSDFTESSDEQVDGVEISKLENGQFIGQCVKNGARIPYVSLTSKEKWLKTEDWVRAKDFNI